jgi:hypothetical protein
MMPIMTGRVPFLLPLFLDGPLFSLECKTKTFTGIAHHPLGAGGQAGVAAA